MAGGEHAGKADKGVSVVGGLGARDTNKLNEQVEKLVVGEH